MPRASPGRAPRERRSLRVMRRALYAIHTKINKDKIIIIIMIRVVVIAIVVYIYIYIYIYVYIYIYICIHMYSYIGIFRGALPPVHLLRVFLLRVLESNFPGGSL